MDRISKFKTALACALVAVLFTGLSSEPAKSLELSKRQPFGPQREITAPAPSAANSGFNAGRECISSDQLKDLNGTHQPFVVVEQRGSIVTISCPTDSEVQIIESTGVRVINKSLTVVAQTAHAVQTVSTKFQTLVSAQSGEISVDVQDFLPFSNFQVFLYATRSRLASDYVDSLSKGSVSFKIPSDASVGYHTLQIVGIAPDSTLATLNLPIVIKREQRVEGKGSSSAPAPNSLPAGWVGEKWILPRAKSSAGLYVSYTLEASSATICSLDGNTLTYLRQGTCAVRLSQLGDEFTFAADEALISGHIKSPPQSITVSVRFQRGKAKPTSLSSAQIRKQLSQLIVAGDDSRLKASIKALVYRSPGRQVDSSEKLTRGRQDYLVKLAKGIVHPDMKAGMAVEASSSKTMLIDQGWVTVRFVARETSPKPIPNLVYITN